MGLGVNRRGLLAAGPLLMLGGAGPATEADLPGETIALWPGAAPGGEAVKAAERRVPYNWPDGRVDYSIVGVTRPTLTIYRPVGALPPKFAVLVLPGGGFNKVVIDKEGHDVARWLAGQGIAAGVLLYRLPTDRWSAGVDAPLQDAQRALRLLKAKVGASRTGALGFSAGATLAAALASRGAAPLYPPVDALDGRPVLPDFIGLGYVWLTTPKPRGPEWTPFHGFTVPTQAFIFHAADDPKVPIANAREGAAAIRAAGGQAEVHEYPTGGHGFALRSPPDAPEAAWAGQFLAWLDRLGG
ncbi:alpha/beta hydrolase [Caulobacter rhizosphaerae]|jgi:acetyl esterase/lipase|uniref:alpha/beta hydrolase n=1 Tax=Caulobacter rhizosphaerae TaxID=2010972 RepID=UPI0013D7DCA7|nr:dienelactone hydrolase family protein [Caulobacter rhizosphaerae]GGL38309.1 alpha/beta hydrolase [Caulobacter rhizosphaerae]